MRKIKYTIRDKVRSSGSKYSTQLCLDRSEMFGYDQSGIGYKSGDGFLSEHGGGAGFTLEDGEGFGDGEVFRLHRRIILSKILA